MQFRVYPATDDQTRSDHNDFYRQAVLETDTKLFKYQGEEERLERINHLKNALNDAFSLLWGGEVVVECDQDGYPDSILD